MIYVSGDAPFVKHTIPLFQEFFDGLFTGLRPVGRAFVSTVHENVDLRVARVIPISALSAHRSSVSCLAVSGSHDSENLSSTFFKNLWKTQFRPVSARLSRKWTICRYRPVCRCRRPGQFSALEPCRPRRNFHWQWPQSRPDHPPGRLAARCNRCGR